MLNSKSYKEAKAEVHKLLKDKTIVGHSLKHDFNVLGLKEEGLLT